MNYRPDDRVSREEFVRRTLSKDVWETEVVAGTTEKCFKDWQNEQVLHCKEMSEEQLTEYLFGNI